MSVAGALVTSKELPMHLVNDHLDGFYVDGLSITYGSPRQHIWSFVVGFTEEHCFCDDPNLSLGSPPPSFVENNYFCESGSAAVGFSVGLGETVPGNLL